MQSVHLDRDEDILHLEDLEDIVMDEFTIRLQIGEVSTRALEHLATIWSDVHVHEMHIDHCTIDPLVPNVLNHVTMLYLFNCHATTPDWDHVTSIRELEIVGGTVQHLEGLFQSAPLRELHITNARVGDIYWALSTCPTLDYIYWMGPCSSLAKTILRTRAHLVTNLQTPAIDQAKMFRPHAIHVIKE